MNFEILPLFSIPFLKAKILFDKSGIVYRDDYKNHNSENNNVLVSKSQTVLDEKEYSFVRYRIEDLLYLFCHDALQISEDWELVHVNSWQIEVSGTSSSKLHSHANSMFSGVLYLSTDGKANPIKFVCGNRPTFCTGTILPDIKSYNIYNIQSLEFIPEEGDIYIFPSFLEHEVLKSSDSDSKRTSLAFNYMLNGSSRTDTSCVTANFKH
jgi:uncharacterized protein (TIGR02466 family)